MVPHTYLCIQMFAWEFYKALEILVHSDLKIQGFVYEWQKFTSISVR